MRAPGLIRLFAAVGALAATSSAHAVDVTSTFTVSMQINPICSIVSAGNLTFPASNYLASAVTATSTLSVKCTNGTPFNIGLNLASGETLEGRLLHGTVPTNTLTYAMYSDSGHTDPWGQAAPDDTLNDTGDGTTKSYTVFGNLPAQTPPATGAYSELVTVTVTY